MREPGPGRLLPGLVQLFFRASFLAAALVTPPGGMGRVKLTAPAAAMAASANELDADGWRPIIGGGEGRPASGYGCSCCTGSPSRRATGGVASQAPIRRPAGAQAAAMTMYLGTGLLSQQTKRGVAGSCCTASVPGTGGFSRLDVRSRSGRPRVQSHRICAADRWSPKSRQATRSADQGAP